MGADVGGRGNHMLDGRCGGLDRAEFITFDLRTGEICNWPEEIQPPLTLFTFKEP